MTGRATRSSGLGPTARTLILGSMGLGCGLSMLVAVFVGLSDGGRAADALTSRSLPASVALQDLSEATVRGRDDFLIAVHTPDPDARTVALAGVLDADEAQDVAWRTYRDVAVDSPDEQALRRTYEASRSRTRELGAAIVTGGSDDPTRTALLVEMGATTASEIDGLHALEHEIYLPMIQSNAVAASAGIDTVRTAVGVTSAATAVLFSIVGVALLLGARRDERLRSAEAIALRLAADTASFERSLRAGLEMAPTEDAGFDVVHQALELAAPDLPAEMLVADSSRAHFRQVLCTGSGDENRCRVNSPGECPAAAAGQTRLFEDSARLDSCGFLREHERAWAVCVPVSIAGRHTGVIRVQQPVGAPRPEALPAALELVARKTGDRIGVLRVFAKTQAQAQVDPLTGLPNRRSLEEQVRDLQVGDGPYVVGFADLDHFKAINDIHGHDTGDRALRLFARVLRDSIRPRDLLARHGGEEFMIVLPDCSIADARVVGERIRSALATALDKAAVPAFTVTIGLAAAEPGDDLASVVASADRAMISAKVDGRDRVVAAGDEPSARAA